MVWVVTSSFHFLYYLFGPFFFMMCLAKCLSVLVIFSKNQFLVSLILSISFISTHFYFLFYTDFGLCSSFSSFCRCQGRLFEIFLISWNRHHGIVLSSEKIYSIVIYFHFERKVMLFRIEFTHDCSSFILNWFMTKFWSIYIYLSMHTLLLLYDLIFKVVKHKIIKQKMSLASFKLNSSAFSLKLSYVGTSQFVCFPYFLLWHSQMSCFLVAYSWVQVLEINCLGS